MSAREASWRNATISQGWLGLLTFWIGACQNVLGLSDHQLGPIDRSVELRSNLGGAAGDSGTAVPTETRLKPVTWTQANAGSGGNLAAPTAQSSAIAVTSAGTLETWLALTNAGSGGTLHAVGTSGAGGLPDTAEAPGTAGLPTTTVDGQSNAGGRSAETSGIAGAAGAAVQRGTGGSSQGQARGGGNSIAASSAGTSGACYRCALGAAIVHRYSFEGTGTRATDSVGNAHGTIIGTKLLGQGSVSLSGTGEYVVLPSGILSTLTSATFEAWVTWRGGLPWQKLFEFGNANGGTESKRYLYVTPEADSTSGFPRAVYQKGASASEVQLNATSGFPQDVWVHVALVFNGANQTFSLFINGTQRNSGQVPGSLSNLSDTDNWLGHSQYSGAPDFNGELHEFRIYDTALSPTQLYLSYKLGEAVAF